MERGSEWGSGQGVAGSPLIEMVQKANADMKVVDRRAQIVERMVARLEENRGRRRVKRVFAAGAASVLAAGLLATLRLVGVPWLAR